MNKILVVFLFLVLTVTVVSVHALEKAKPVFDERTWTLGWSQNQDGQIFEEYVVNDETVENWSELVTIQFFAGLNQQTSPDLFEAFQKEGLVSVCPSIEWESIVQSKGERIWKWTIAGCQGQPDQSELARLKATDKGFHIWHYAIKKSPMPSDLERLWLEKLKAIEIVEQ